MDQRPASYRVTTGDGPGALLSVIAFVLVVGSVGAVGWLGGSPGRDGSSTEPELGTSTTGPDGSAGRGSGGPQGIGGQPAESPNFTTLPISRIVGDVEVFEPTPGGTVPGTGFLLFAGRVLSYSPHQIEARLKIAGRPDVLASIEDVRGGAFAGWLMVPPPVGTVDAVLEISDGASRPTVCRSRTATESAWRSRFTRPPSHPRQDPRGMVSTAQSARDFARDFGSGALTA